MADISPQNLDNDGLDSITFAAASAGGDAYVNDNPDRYIAVFRDTGGTGGQVVTPTIQNTDFDLPPYGDVQAKTKAKTVAANGFVVFHDLSDLVFNDGSGKVNFTYSSETNLEVALIKLV